MIQCPEALLSSSYIIHNGGYHPANHGRNNICDRLLPRLLRYHAPPAQSKLTIIDIVSCVVYQMLGLDEIFQRDGRGGVCGLDDHVPPST